MCCDCASPCCPVNTAWFTATQLYVRVMLTGCVDLAYHPATKHNHLLILQPRTLLTWQHTDVLTWQHTNVLTWQHNDLRAQGFADLAAQRGADMATKWFADLAALTQPSVKVRTASDLSLASGELGNIRAMMLRVLAIFWV